MSCCNQQSYSAFRNGQNEDTWLRGRASVMLSEGRWFSSPCLHVEVSLGKILNPNLPLMCWSAPRMAAISIWMYIWITVSGFGKKASAKCPKKYWNKNKLCSLAPGKCKRVWFKCGISSQKKKEKKKESAVNDPRPVKDRSSCASPNPEARSGFTLCITLCCMPSPLSLRLHFQMETKCVFENKSQTCLVNMSVYILFIYPIIIWSPSPCCAATTTDSMSDA